MKGLVQGIKEGIILAISLGPQEHYTVRGLAGKSQYCCLIITMLSRAN